jgi:drug/metabolite transporter (DMT)-like permease
MPPAVAFAACALIWGSTWLAIKVGYGGVGALTGAALRFGLAAVLLAVMMVALRMPRPSRLALKLAVVQAVFLFLLDYGLIYWAEQQLSSSLTALLFATFPLLTALVAHVARDERLSTRKVAGVVLGIGGLGVVFADSLAFEPARAPAMALVVGSALCAAISNVITHREGGSLHPASYTMPAMALGAGLLTLAAVGIGEPLALPTGNVAWLSVLYLSAVGSVVAFLAFFALMKRWGPSKASMLILLTPLVALALGAAVLSENPGLPAAVGTALVLAGVGITLRAPKAETKPVGARTADPALDAVPEN